MHLAVPGSEPVYLHVSLKCRIMESTEKLKHDDGE